MFGCLKDWRRVANGYDSCAKTFLPAVVHAATVMFCFEDQWVLILAILPGQIQIEPLPIKMRPAQLLA